MCALWFVLPMLAVMFVLTVVVTALLVRERRRARSVTVAHVQDSAAERVLARLERLNEQRRRASGGEL